MRVRPGYYSENFTKDEFGHIEPESLLLTVLERLRVKIGNFPILIASSARTFEQHVDIYKKLERQGMLGDLKWHEAIPLNSRHLPAFGTNTRAADISAVKGERGAMKSYYTGDDLLPLLKEIEEEMDIFLGIGIGKDFCHIDIGRKQPVTWYYNY
jgi:hypothetical protein